jgi:hypothetical protein
LRVAARSLTIREPPAPRPRKKAKTGGDGKGYMGGGERFTTRNLAADYVKLCQHPLKDLRRWLAEDKKRAGATGRETKSFTTKGGDYAHTKGASVVMETAGWLRRQSLLQVRGRLDADGSRGRGADNVSARSRAGAGRYDGLRSVRGEETRLASNSASEIASAPDASLDGESATILAFYGAKIALTRRSVPARDVSAAVKAILDEQSAAFRALADRRHAVMRAARERRRDLRHADREASRIERAGVPDAQPS